MSLNQVSEGHRDSLDLGVLSWLRLNGTYGVFGVEMWFDCLSEFCNLKPCNIHPNERSSEPRDSLK